MKKYIGIFLLLAVVAVFPLSATAFAAGTSSAEPSGQRLHITIPLESLSLPAKDYMLLVDTTPETMEGGHIAVKAPCNDDGVSSIQVLQGVAEETMHKVELNMSNMLHELSTHGESCLYHVGLPDDEEWAVTDVAIFNPNTVPVTFSAADSITVYVNAFGTVSGGHHGSEDESSKESSHSEHDSDDSKESSHSEHESEESHNDMTHGSSYAEIENIYQMGTNLHVVKVSVHAVDETISGASLLIESDRSQSIVSIPTVKEGSSVSVPGTIRAYDVDSITVTIQ